MNLQDSLQEPKNKTACTAWRQFDLLQTLLASLHRNQAQRGIMGSALQHSSATVVHWDSNFLKNIFGRRGTWVEIVDTINLVAPDAFISNIVMWCRRLMWTFSKIHDNWASLMMPLTNSPVKFLQQVASTLQNLRVTFLNPWSNASQILSSPFLPPYPVLDTQNF